MAEQFKYVEVPPEMRKILGEPWPGTRIYAVEGPADFVDRWAEAVEQVTDGHMVSPGGAQLVIPRSRSSVQHRIQRGQLTVFMYRVVERKSFLGFKYELREEPYIWLASSELREWREDIVYEGVRDGKISQAELDRWRSADLGDFIKPVDREKWEDDAKG
ncbi:MAG: hypothetical protein LV481_11510 [Methylacidiphilales bacterium]|nr:hypothetical protein [Candidatus Methylacidiphilales bacterium]